MRIGTNYGQNLNNLLRFSSQLKGGGSRLSANSFSTFKNDALIASNLAKAKDKNGRWINSDGMEGMDITGRTDWKEIVPISDEVKDKMLAVVKDDFIRSNGGIPDDSIRNEVTKAYLWTLPADERASASWTLDRLRIDEGARLTDLVKQHIPSWQPGEPFDPSILDAPAKGNLNVKA